MATILSEPSPHPHPPRHRGCAHFFNRSTLGFPWWSSGKESARQCRGHRLDPWSWEVSHTVGQLSPCTTSTEPMCHKHWGLHTPEPTLHKRSHTSDRNWRKPKCTNKDAAQPKPTKYKFENIYIHSEDLLYGHQRRAGPCPQCKARGLAEETAVTKGS